MAPPGAPLARLLVRNARKKCARAFWSAISFAKVGLRKVSGSARKTVLRVLEICSGCCSVSAAARKEAEDFGVDVEVFSVDGKPSTNASRVVDILTWDWENDELLNKFRREQEDGVRYIWYAHASPPCGPYSSMSCPTEGPLAQRDLRWGDSVAQRCLELMHWFEPDFWTVESRGPPGLDTRPFMRTLIRANLSWRYFLVFLRLFFLLLFLHRLICRLPLLCLHSFQCLLRDDLGNQETLGCLVVASADGVQSGTHGSLGVDPAVALLEVSKLPGHERDGWRPQLRRDNEVPLRKVAVAVRYRRGQPLPLEQQLAHGCLSRLSDDCRQRRCGNCHGIHGGGQEEGERTNAGNGCGNTECAQAR